MNKPFEGLEEEYIRKLKEENKWLLERVTILGERITFLEDIILDLENKLNKYEWGEK
jgi:hypothetical protein